MKKVLFEMNKNNEPMSICQSCKGDNLHMAYSIGRYQVQCKDCGYYGQAMATKQKALEQWNRPNHLEDKVSELYKYVLEEIECRKRGQENAHKAGLGYEMDYQRGMKDACNRIKVMMDMSFSFLHD